MLNITQDLLLEQVEKIYKFIRTSGGKFGDTNIPTKDNVFKSMSQALPDIADYCKEYKIEITELDTIKLLIFAMPHLKKNDPSINIERYIKSIFLLLENSYAISIKDDINSSIMVCAQLFYKDKILVIYGYIKGFQEALKYQR